MARIRTIKPEFWSDGSIIECSTNARLLFVGTWNFADDFGNLDRSAKQIKAQVFPADSFDCEPLIQELIDRRLLVEYSANGKKYLHIQSFAKHQKVDRPGAPRCPAFDDSLIVQRTFDESSPSVRDGREGKGREGKTPVAASGGFDRFWKAYPRKVAKPAALKAWGKAKPDDLLTERIIRAVQAQSSCEQWTKDGGAFIPHPATWLNNRRWEDETGTTGARGEPGGPDFALAVG